MAARSLPQRSSPPPVARRAVSGGQWDAALYLVLIGWAAMAAGRTLLGLNGLYLELLPPIGIGVGWLLARWRALPAVVAHWLALLLAGVLIVRLAGPLALSRVPTWQGQVEALFYRLYLWLDHLQRGQPTDEPVLALAALIGLATLIGYQAAWVYARLGWFWPAVLPAGLVVLVASGLAQPVTPLYLCIYLLGLVALLTRQQAHRRELGWRSLGIGAPRYYLAQVIGGTTVATLAVLTVSLLLPALGRDARLAQAWERFSEPWRHLDSTISRTLNQLQGGSSAGSWASFSTRFEINGFPALSDAPVARIASDTPRYVKIIAYDRYTGRGWETSTPDSFPTLDGRGAVFSSQVQLNPPQRLPIEPLRAPVQAIDVELIQPKGTLLLVPGQFAQAPQPVNVRVGWARYQQEEFGLETLDINQLPGLLRPVASNLRAARDLPDAEVLLNADGSLRQQLAGGRLSPLAAEVLADIERLRRERSVEVAFVAGGGRATRLIVSGYVPWYEDAESVSATTALSPGSRYSLSVIASEPSAASLRVATGQPPAWVRERYLTVPPSMPLRVKEMALSIAAAETNPYDRARALERALRTLPYDEQVGGPPAGRDVVDYFLFDSRRGYCEYFASAMTMMARSIGLPARVVTGYNPGEPIAGGRLIRERNAHAWVEVYFDGHGWVAFEPTPANAANPRGEGAAEAAQSPLGPPVPPELPLPASETAPAGEPNAGAESDDGPAWLGHLARAVQLALLIAALALAVVSTAWWRGVRGLTGAGRWYGRLAWLGRWAGLRPGVAATPYEIATTISRATPAAADEIDTITRLYVEERYGRQALSTTDEQLAQRAWRRARLVLLRYLLRLER